MTDHKARIDQFWSLFEAGKIDEIGALVDADVSFKMPGAPEMRGWGAVSQLLSAYRVAFPDLRHRVDHHVSSGDTIALELVAEGTHTGPMHTPKGVVPATGKKVTWESCDYIRVKNGKLISWHVYHDTVPFLTALGLMAA